MVHRIIPRTRNLPGLARAGRTMMLPGTTARTGITGRTGNARPGTKRRRNRGTLAGPGIEGDRDARRGGAIWSASGHPIRGALPYSFQHTP